MNALFTQKNSEFFLKELFKQLPKESGLDYIRSGISRAEVYAMACQLGAEFRELAMAEGSATSKVPICLVAEERSVIAAALLAALSTGSILVLPHSFSSLALSQMQESTGYVAAVVDVDRPLPNGVHHISCGASSRSSELPKGLLSGEIELLRIFTGGSTGSPKIWSKTAGNLFGEALYMAAGYQIDHKDTLLSTVSPYHIYGLLFSVVIPLVSKAAICRETPLFPTEIVECSRQGSATILVSIPPHYRVIKERKPGSSLRLAFSSAGMLPEEDGRVFTKNNGVGVVEVYGSTETGGLATRDRSAGEIFFSPLKPVIYKIKNDRLHVKSPFLCPDLPLDSEGFFLSGDKVREEATGQFSLHGRADAVTKVGGVRVDLDEVRDLLQSQASVEECMVLSLLDETGRGNRVEALVRGEGADPARLKKALALQLEPAALPRRILVVPVIPLTSTGKYDRDVIRRILSGV